MRDAYLNIADPQAQDDFFDDVARRVFKNALAGSDDPKGMLSGLTDAVGERRLMLWSTHPEEQDKIAGTAVAGELAGDVQQDPDIGVFINDSAADKLSYYLDYRVDVKPRSCGTEGNQIIDVELTMKSTVPRGRRPAAVGRRARAATRSRRASCSTPTTSTHPPAAASTRSPVVGTRCPPPPTRYKGREVSSFTMSLQPGEKRVVDYVVITGRDQTGDPRLTTTPAATTDGHGFVGHSAC